MEPYAYPGLFYPGQVYPGQSVLKKNPSASSVDTAYSVDYRFDLLDRKENPTGTVKSVMPGGELKWHRTKSIKSGGKMKIQDIGQKIDWLNVRVKPVRVHNRLDGTVEEYPLGVFLTSAPVEVWSMEGRTWDVELLDKCSILDSDIVTNEDGDPVTFSATAGDRVVDLVVELIERTGEDTPAISREISDRSINTDMTWEIGTTLLKICNELLNASGHFSLWCDEEGQFQVTPYEPPADRAVVYADGTEFGLDTPFSNGPSSLMSPDWTRDLDTYAIPNRWVCITQGDADQEGIVAVAVNEDPESPFSSVSRGTPGNPRWVTQVETGVEAVDEDSLLARAEQALADATSTTVGIEVDHMFLPEVKINSVVHFVNEAADGLDMLASVLNTTVPFDPVALCKTEFREFSGSNQTWPEKVDDT